MCWRRTNTPTLERIKTKKKNKECERRAGKRNKAGREGYVFAGVAGAERCSVTDEMEMWPKEGGRPAGEKEERIMFS